MTRSHLRRRKAAHRTGFEEGKLQARKELGVRWLPISQADRSITDVQDFSEVGVLLRLSERYWVRDEAGRIFEAVWTDDRNGYWWDLDSESPTDPVEFMPHPLDRRFAGAAEASSDAIKADSQEIGCQICLEPLKSDDICSTDIELGICHAECLAGAPVVDLNTGKPSDGPVDTYRYNSLDEVKP